LVNGGEEIFGQGGDERYEGVEMSSCVLRIQAAQKVSGEVLGACFEFR
jgi:hypothetical protein